MIGYRATPIVDRMDLPGRMRFVPARSMRSWTGPPSTAGTGPRGYPARPERGAGRDPRRRADGLAPVRTRRATVQLACDLASVPGGDLGARADAELVHQVLDVRLHGPRREVESLADLPVAETLRDQGRNLELPGAHA
jgi:hypothetical protein